MLSKNITSNVKPLALNPHQKFISPEEAANFLQISEKEFLSIAEAEKFTKFPVRMGVLYRIEEVRVLEQRLKENSSTSEITDKDTTGTINLVIWIVCGLVAFGAFFAKKIILLETVVPVLAFMGFITFGIVLLKAHKNKEKQKKQKQLHDETEKNLALAERLQKLNEKD